MCSPAGVNLLRQFCWLPSVEDRWTGDVRLLSEGIQSEGVGVSQVEHKFLLRVRIMGFHCNSSTAKGSMTKMYMVLRNNFFVSYTAFCKRHGLCTLLIKKRTIICEFESMWKIAATFYTY